MDEADYYPQFISTETKLKLSQNTWLRINVPNESKKSSGLYATPLFLIAIKKKKSCYFLACNLEEKIMFMRFFLSACCCQ